MEQSKYFGYFSASVLKTMIRDGARGKKNNPSCKKDLPKIIAWNNICAHNPQIVSSDKQLLFHYLHNVYD